MNSDSVFTQLVQLLEQSGVPFTIHEHSPMRTMADAEEYQLFDVARIVKTVTFRARDGSMILTALKGAARVDYSRLAACVGVTRRDLSPLSPQEVCELLGVEPGSVSPLQFDADTVLFIDADLLTILPTLYCGIGRSDRTLEIASTDLVRISNGHICSFSK